MMSLIRKYKEWSQNPKLDKRLKRLMNADEMIFPTSKMLMKIKDRFSEDLQFGTAGLRGELGYGTNRMNIHVVAKASQGLAQAVLNEGAPERGVVIGYDVRHYSREFAEIAAGVFIKNGIKVYLFEDVAPTPLVSYAIRKLGAQAGVMITASHNPSNYNGYKVYWSDGAQITSENAEKISSEINAIKDVFSVEYLISKKQRDKVIMLGEEMENVYKKEVLSLQFQKDVNLDKDLTIVYSPLNGVGRKLMLDLLQEQGYENIYVVREQEFPDSDFTTTGTPNPEDPVAYKLALELAEEVNADLILTTDPDADRLGVMVKHYDDYVMLSGNQLGVLLADYILSTLSIYDKLPENSAVVSTIATDKMIEKIADYYNIKSHRVHVGFKNIYKLAEEWEKTNQYEYLFGFEESLGFGITKNIARDKDALSAGLLVAELAAYLRTTGETLVDYYNKLSLLHGVHLSETISLKMKGVNGNQVMKGVMKEIRESFVEKIGEEKLIRKVDYINSETELGKENVVLFEYSKGTWVLVRPSGTEPKLKIYIHTVSADKRNSRSKLSLAKEAVVNKIEKEARNLQNRPS